MTDCLGLKLEEAEKLLNAQAVKYRVIEAAPFYRGLPEPPATGAAWVIKQNFTDDGLELTVCRIAEQSDRR